MKAFGLSVVVGVTGLLLMAAFYWLPGIAHADVVGADLRAGAVGLLGVLLVLSSTGMAAFGAITGSGSRLGSIVVMIMVPVIAVIIYSVGVSGFEDSDPLAEIESSDSVDATQQQICAKAKPGLLDGVKVTATTEAPFHEVKAAMVSRYGQAKADAAAGDIGDDVVVTLCAVDRSSQPTTPQVDSAVLAVANGSSWWASGPLR